MNIKKENAAPNSACSGINIKQQKIPKEIPTELDINIGLECPPDKIFEDSNRLIDINKPEAEIKNVIEVFIL